MKKETITFATVTRNGVVEHIGRSSLPKPEIKFNGKGIKWYEDKMKKQEDK